MPLLMTCPRATLLLGRKTAATRTSKPRTANTEDVQILDCPGLPRCHLYGIYPAGPLLLLHSAQHYGWS
ncbi:hypothetical protein V5799_013240 [Amblyomma americanum]|uniref:Uncharacterized protein n=1 Tax=Amblyomma americanum TaxID=6943 RepID=A0AAQ4E6H2_AMBAM